MRLRLLLVASLLCLAHAATAAPPHRPNILLIFADDESYKTVGCYPESWPWVKTPNIDRLAANGIRFHGAYLGSWCMPSRASILTGRHPHGIESMRMAGTYPASTYDPQQTPFVFAEFRKQGYQTAHIGKWHTGTDAGWGRDWDYQIVWNRPKHPENAGAYYDTQILAINGQEKTVEGYPADNYTNWAVDYIKGQHRDPAKPWYLWLCYGNIHGPSKPAPRHKGMYANQPVPTPADIFPPREGKPAYLEKTQAWVKDKAGRIVARGNNEAVGDEVGKKKGTFEAWVRQVNECMPAVDEGVGRLVDALRETGQLDDTLIIYTADQGFAMGEHGMRIKLAPYDANYRSPLIVSMPKRFPTSKTCDVPVNAPDLVATICATAGVTIPWPLHGRDITPLLKDPASPWPYPTIYQHAGDTFGREVARITNTDPAKADYHDVPWYTAVIQDGFKLIHYHNPAVGDELYDRKSDPEELHNLIHSPDHHQRLTSLQEALASELRRTDAGFGLK